MKGAWKKLHSLSGITRAAVVLLLGIIALSAAIIVPYIQHDRETAAAAGCAIAIEEAQRKIDDAMLLSGGNLDPPAARYAAVRDIKDWGELCPSGGDCALIKDGEKGYRVVCALHTSDYEMRTRLNSDNAYTRLRSELEACAQRGEAIPETVTVTINARPLTITLAETEPPISRGTRTTPGYDGVVAFYGVEGDRLSWFCYADEEHCAFCREGLGWQLDGTVRVS